MRRRELLGAGALALTAPWWLRAAPSAPASITKAPGAAPPAAPAFDYAWLKGQARARAARAHAPVPEADAPALAALDWDHYQLIRFRPERALWARDKLRFRVQFFHLGLHYRQPVRMHLVEAGVARPIVYDESMFDLSRSNLMPAALPKDLGFAGFRIHFHSDFRRDVTVFLGASYFRAVGASLQYGLSARGLAVDCGMSKPEEFPAFTDFWLERPAADSDTLRVFALLDSRSITGAYRFDITPGAVQAMRIDAALYPRAAIERLGVAPLTSMFLCAPHDRRVDDDWRPSIHDSDGLAMWNGRGEWLWRPLSNPEAVRFNTFEDPGPRGFGLLQRDRNFDHYQDDGVFYDKRPSAWVEPISGFGAGSVDLLEIPAGDETADNIVAFWQPAQAPRAGEEMLCAYRLYWGDEAPSQPPLARAAMSWSGIGGVVGSARDHFSWRFVVDFAGAVFAKLPAHAKVEAVVSASKGTTELVSARPLASIKGYRAMFDLRPGNMREPIDLRLYLRLGDAAISETWLYQWKPPPHTAP